jgi:hypothetical protein
LHELLGLHPCVRSHSLWEQEEPVPRTNTETTEALKTDFNNRKNDPFKKFRLKMLLAIAGN